MTTPDTRRQSKTLLKVHERGSKITRNSVFDYHLTPVRRQVSIENSVSDEFDLHQSIVLAFRLPPIRCDEKLLMFHFLFTGMGGMANRNMQQNMGGMNQYGKMGMDGSRGISNQMGTQSQMGSGMQNQMRSGIQSLMGSDMPSQMGSSMQNQMGTGSMRNEMDRFSDQRGKNSRF